MGSKNKSRLHNSFGKRSCGQTAHVNKTCMYVYVCTPSLCFDSYEFPEIQSFISRNCLALNFLSFPQTVDFFGLFDLYFFMFVWLSWFLLRLIPMLFLIFWLVSFLQSLSSWNSGLVGLFSFDFAIELVSLCFSVLLCVWIFDILNLLHSSILFEFAERCDVCMRHLTLRFEQYGVGGLLESLKSLKFFWKFQIFEFCLLCLWWVVCSLAFFYLLKNSIDIDRAHRNL